MNEFRTPDIYASLFSILGTPDRDKMSFMLYNMSQHPENCVAMRQAGCIPLLVHLIYSSGAGEPDVRWRANEVVANIIAVHDRDERGRQESRVLKLLQRVQGYSDALRGFDPQPNTLDMRCVEDPCNSDHSILLNPLNAISSLMKLTFDEEYRHSVCTLGGLQALAEALQLEEVTYPMEGYVNRVSVTMRRYICMALTNLTFGDGVNKSLLCSMGHALEAVVAQLISPNEELRQAAAGLLRNLSWKSDSTCKTALKQVKAARAMSRAALSPNINENTLRSVLSALWNLSSHCFDNKIEICSQPGLLQLLIQTLRYKSSSQTLSIIENGGGVLKNVSGHVASREEYRLILRKNHCLSILLRLLRSPSLTVVGNTCGTLKNLSNGCNEDRQILINLGGIAMLQRLVRSKHKSIATGSAATLRNIFSNSNINNFSDDYFLSKDNVLGNVLGRELMLEHRGKQMMRREMEESQQLLKFSQHHDEDDTSSDNSDNCQHYIRQADSNYYDDGSICNALSKSDSEMLNRSLLMNDSPWISRQNYSNNAASCIVDSRFSFDQEFTSDCCLSKIDLNCIHNLPNNLYNENIAKYVIESPKLNCCASIQNYSFYNQYSRQPEYNNSEILELDLENDMMKVTFDENGHLVFAEANANNHSIIETDLCNEIQENDFLFNYDYNKVLNSCTNDLIICDDEDMSQNRKHYLKIKTDDLVIDHADNNLDELNIKYSLPEDNLFLKENESKIILYKNESYETCKDKLFLEKVNNWQVCSPCISPNLQCLTNHYEANSPIGPINHYLTNDLYSENILEINEITNESFYQGNYIDQFSINKNSFTINKGTSNKSKNSSTIEDELSINDSKLLEVNSNNQKLNIFNLNSQPPHSFDINESSCSNSIISETLMMQHEFITRSSDAERMAEYLSGAGEELMTNQVPLSNISDLISELEEIISEPKARILKPKQINQLGKKDSPLKSIRGRKKSLYPSQKQIAFNATNNTNESKNTNHPLKPGSSNSKKYNSNASINDSIKNLSTKIQIPVKLELANSPILSPISNTRPISVAMKKSTTADGNIKLIVQNKSRSLPYSSSLMPPPSNQNTSKLNFEASKCIKTNSLNSSEKSSEILCADNLSATSSVNDKKHKYKYSTENRSISQSSNSVKNNQQMNMLSANSSKFRSKNCSFNSNNEKNSLVSSSNSDLKISKLVRSFTYDKISQDKNLAEIGESKEVSLKQNIPMIATEIINTDNHSIILNHNQSISKLQNNPIKTHVQSKNIFNTGFSFAAHKNKNHIEKNFNKILSNKILTEANIKYGEVKLKPNPYHNRGFSFWKKHEVDSLENKFESNKIRSMMKDRVLNWFKRPNHIPVKPKLSDNTASKKFNGNNTTDDNMNLSNITIKDSLCNEKSYENSTFVRNESVETNIKLQRKETIQSNNTGSITKILDETGSSKLDSDGSHKSYIISVDPDISSNPLAIPMDMDESRKSYVVSASDEGISSIASSLSFQK